ncbi:MAG: hypothetical protein Q9227_006381 [Pyrenula ochraceoflavens]
MIFSSAGILFLFLRLVSADYPGFNYPAGVDVWCGKAYRPTNASFNPGGWLEQPTASSEPLLNFHIRPRMSIYVSDDSVGSFIIDTEVSYVHGQPIPSNIAASCGGNQSACTDMDITVTVSGSTNPLINNRTLAFNTTLNEIEFSLAGLSPQMQAYTVVATASMNQGSTFKAQTSFQYLPARVDGGSAVKLDSLYGGLMVQDTSSSSKWTPLFPYSFFVSWSGFAGLGIDNANAFKEQGYNIIHIISDFPSPDFNFTYVDAFLTRCDEIGLYVMYDMRGTYKNASEVTTQVSWLTPHPSLLLWYTADEPDGNTDPLNATKITYDLLKSLDPYHPVSLCLNCYNFYFNEYSSGADIIMPDVYPVSTDTSYSSVYGTVCNTTYGCCGCDDCKGSFRDISERLDRFAMYKDWLNTPQKVSWSVPQAFGSSQFWTRIPTQKEMVVMDVLAVNHNAKGLVAWTYPTNSSLENIRSQLARILTAETPTRFLLNASAVALNVNGAGDVDAAAWIVNEQILISVVNTGYTNYTSGISFVSPKGVQVTGIGDTLWGSAPTLSGGSLIFSSIQALEVDMFVLNIAASDALDKS